ncbi:MAG TPA: peptidyl-prolyl cis-trans isomerase [Verrucomicrobiota bacterium]|nr:peptidyl-prolyl cis-trans isomerase [Verrucomicrobiota bacterium]
MRKFAAFIVFLGIFSINASAQVKLSDAIAVIVHTNVIAARDIDNRIMPAVQMLYTQYADNPDELNKRAMQLRREAIESLVEEELILQEFADSKLVLPENYVEEEVARRIRKSYGDRLSLIKTLKARGLTYDSFYRQTREEVIIQAMYGKNVSSVNLISPQMILDYYQENQKDFWVDDQVRIRSIVWTKNEQNADEVRKLAAEVLEMIRNGASFEEMVSIYSEDQSMKLAKEAHLDWRDRTSMQTKLADAAFSMKPGDVSDLIETDNAIWIIKLEDIKAAHTLGIEEVRSSIESILKEQLQTNLKKNWVDRLKKKYLVRYY